MTPSQYLSAATSSTGGNSGGPDTHPDLGNAATSIYESPYIGVNGGVHSSSIPPPPHSMFSPLRLSDSNSTMQQSSSLSGEQANSPAGAAMSPTRTLEISDPGSQAIIALQQQITSTSSPLAAKSTEGHTTAADFLPPPSPTACGDTACVSAMNGVLAEPPSAPYFTAFPRQSGSGNLQTGQTPSSQNDTQKGVYLPGDSPPMRGPVGGVLPVGAYNGAAMDAYRGSAQNSADLHHQYTNPHRSTSPPKMGLAASSGCPAGSPQGQQQQQQRYHTTGSSPQMQGATSGPYEWGGSNTNAAVNTSSSDTSGADAKPTDTLHKLVGELTSFERRAVALQELSRSRELYADMAPILWHSVGTVAALLQEVIKIYPFLSPPMLSSAESNQVCNALTLLQCLASHPETRQSFLAAHIPLYLYPFLNTYTKSKPLEYLRLTSLGVMGTLVKADDPQVIRFLLETEIVPLCLKIMETGTELSKTVATFIVQKILTDVGGLRYICAAPDRFKLVFKVFDKMLVALGEEPSHRLLKQILRCYICLGEHPAALEYFRANFPQQLIGLLKERIADEQCKGWLVQVIQLVTNNREPVIGVTGDGRSHSLSSNQYQQSGQSPVPQIIPSGPTYPNFASAAVGEGLMDGGMNAAAAEQLDRLVHSTYAAHQKISAPALVPQQQQFIPHRPLRQQLRPMIHPGRQSNATALLNTLGQGADPSGLLHHSHHYIGPGVMGGYFNTGVQPFVHPGTPNGPNGNSMAAASPTSRSQHYLYRFPGI